VRIVSLLPSTTEILFALGAGDDVVGVTFECDYPAAARSRRIVSTSALSGALTPGQIDAEVKAKLAAGEDLYHLDSGALRDLDPDLVVTQDLCAVCAVDVSTVDAALSYLGCASGVLTVDPSTLDAVLESIRVIGAATGHVEQASTLVAALRLRLHAVSAATRDRPRPRVAVLEWTDPPFTAGHWVPDMVTAAGALPVFGESGDRSGQTTWAALADARPDVVVVAPCGYGLPGAADLARGLLADGVLPAGPAVIAVDADAAFVRPGPRLVDGIEALVALVHPGCLRPRPELATLVRPGQAATQGSVQD
jgi:iron complex transport system substrate-binding protein